MRRDISTFRPASLVQSATPARQKYAVLHLLTDLLTSINTHIHISTRRRSESAYILQVCPSQYESAISFRPNAEYYCRLLANNL